LDSADAAATAVSADKPATQAGPGGFSGGGSLEFLLRAHFVPAFDVWIDQRAAAWGTRNNVEVQLDDILSGELAAKLGGRSRRRRRPS